MDLYTLALNRGDEKDSKWSDKIWQKAQLDFNEMISSTNIEIH